MIKTCLICGQDFEAKQTDQIVCSLECGYAFQSKIFNGELIKNKCKQCGKVFYKLYPSPYCCTECRNEAIEEDREREKLNPKKRLSSLDRTLAYCKRLGISYSEYQKMSTLGMLKGNDNGQ